MISNEKTRFINLSPGDGQRALLVFNLSVGIIPLLYLIVKKVTKINSVKQIFTTLGIIIGSGTLFWIFRLLNLKFRLLNMPSFFGEEVNDVAVSTLIFEQYFLLGLIVGTVLSLFIYRKRRLY
ncbi:MAG: hypothetical protein WCY16_09290 [Weeksellaceae bacterium]